MNARGLMSNGPSNHDGDLLASDDDMQLELEHAIGYLSTGGGPFYHPNGTDMVYAAGASVVICDFNDPHKQSILQGHDAFVTCLALSHAGRLIASGQHGENADVIIWNFETKQLQYRFAEHDHGVSSVAFSHDDQLLCTVGIEEADNRIIIWDMSSGYIVTMVSHDPRPTLVACWGGYVKDIKRRDTNEHLLATAGGNNISLWALNPYTGEMRAEKMTGGGRGATVRRITAIVFSDDKETIYAATTTGDFILADVRNKSTNGRIIQACHLGVHAVLCWPEGVIVGGGDGTVTSLNRDMKEVQQTRLKGAVLGMSFSPDRCEIVAGTDLGYIYRVRVDTLKSIVVCETHFGPVVAVSYAPNCSDRFATASSDCTLRVWDASDYRAVTAAIVKNGGQPTCLVMTLDMMISGWTDGKIRSHDVDTGNLLWVIDNAHQNGVCSLVVSNNERYVMSGGQEGELRVWEMRSRDLVSHLKQHSQRVSHLALFSDDVHALSVSRDRSLICWNLRTEKQVSYHSQRMGGINSVALSADQATVLTVGQEKRTSYWDLREHNPVVVLDLSEDMSDEAFAITTSCSGKLFATGGTGKLLRLFDYESSKQLAVGVGHSSTIRDVKFSPDDKQIVTVGEDGVVIIWNVYA